jgi:hypothetical protein
MINIDPSVYTYTMMAFAFGGVLVVKATEWMLGEIKSSKSAIDSMMELIPIVFATGLLMGLSQQLGGTKVKWYKRWLYRIRIKVSSFTNRILTPKVRYAIPIVTGICCVGFIIANSFFFDIGRNNDVGLEARRYYESLETMPANASIWAGIISGANVGVQYHNDTYDSNIKIYPSWLYNYSLNLEAAGMAWAEDSLYVVDYGYNEYGDLTLNNRKVTEESYAKDWAYINSTAELIHPLTRGNAVFTTPTG